MRLKEGSKKKNQESCFSTLISQTPKVIRLSKNRSFYCLQVYIRTGCAEHMLHLKNKIREAIWVKFYSLGKQEGGMLCRYNQRRIVLRILPCLRRNLAVSTWPLWLATNSATKARWATHSFFCSGPSNSAYGMVPAKSTVTPRWASCRINTNLLVSKEQTDSF